ncbi:hypothetical protein RFI_39411 [Reticulomyxa filosa]|uniref:Uncharacterized protein n=1 Tax=Reticulomyxa filosa TaxID=46433 RepID=X6L9R3_RETFI|nr:hypothetical protein RFI_39411 [Reticulomyxa filosa]|eukprot:ETN98105.1 hypothetical protein RFI_39411 [Reticulomyxa filosa]
MTDPVEDDALKKKLEEMQFEKIKYDKLMEQLGRAICKAAQKSVGTIAIDENNRKDIEDQIMLVNTMETAIVNRDDEIVRLKRENDKLAHDIKIRDEHVKLLQDQIGLSNMWKVDSNEKKLQDDGIGSLNMPQSYRIPRQKSRLSKNSPVEPQSLGTPNTPLSKTSDPGDNKPLQPHTAHPNSRHHTKLKPRQSNSGKLLEIEMERKKQLSFNNENFEDDISQSGDVDAEMTDMA